MSRVPKANITEEESHAANEAWGFNCGPGALCGVLDLKPDQLRPYLLDFEAKGFTNPTLMISILHGLMVPHETIYRSDEGMGHALSTMEGKWPDLGLMRVQWGGRWTKEGVPMRARYRHTHWVGIRVRDGGIEFFDVNFIRYGGWLGFSRWDEDLAPWIIKHCIPGGDGEWWPTHVISLTGKSSLSLSPLHSEPQNQTH